MRKENTTSINEISTIYTIPLGGIVQTILVEGKIRDLPIVITLHGVLGPAWMRY